MRLIDADVLRAVKFHALPYTHIHALGAEPQSYEMGWNDAVDAIMDCAPTVDPVKHGYWNEHKDYPGLAYLCSECGYFTTDRSYYCPNCGARMEDEDV